MLVPVPGLSNLKSKNESKNFKNGSSPIDKINHRVHGLDFSIFWGGQNSEDRIQNIACPDISITVLIQEKNFKYSSEFWILSSEFLSIQNSIFCSKNAYLRLRGVPPEGSIIICSASVLMPFEK